MRIIALNTEAKKFEVFRGKKSTLIDSSYRKGLAVENTHPHVFTKFFSLEVRGQKGVKFEDKAIVQIGKDLDMTISKLLSAGGVYSELFKDVKSHKGNFMLTVIAENHTSLETMRKGYDTSFTGGHYSQESIMQTSKGNVKVPKEKILLVLSYDTDGRPMFRPHLHKHVTIHEFIHKLDLVTSSKSQAVKTLVTALRKNPIYTSPYSRTNDKEMIAELLAFYHLKSDFADYSEQYAQLEALAKQVGVKLSR